MKQNKKRQVKMEKENIVNSMQNKAGSRGNSSEKIEVFGNRTYAKFSLADGGSSLSVSSSGKSSLIQKKIPNLINLSISKIDNKWKGGKNKNNSNKSSLTNKTNNLFSLNIINNKYAEGLI